MHLVLSAAVAVLAYTWIGYPAFLWLLALARRRARPSTEPESWPLVTLLIAVHNGEKHIKRKLENSLALEYPRELLQILVASDGSNDGTEEIVRQYAPHGVELVAIYPQEGKTGAQNRALAHCRGEVIVYSNVQTMLHHDCLRLLARHFTDPRVGGVAPQLIWENLDASDIAHSGGFYWRYEQFLWQLESRLRLLAWAPGACMAIRRSLVKPMPDTYGEDVVLPLWAAADGRPFVYEPAAIVSQPRIASAPAEYRARQRMTLRSFNATFFAWPLKNYLKSPGITWAVLSHKVLRWLTPYFMAVALLSNLALIPHLAFSITLAAQLAFYLVAASGWAAIRRGWRVPGAGAAFSFLVANTAFASGVWLALLGKEIRIFHPVEQPDSPL